MTPLSVGGPHTIQVVATITDGPNTIESTPTSATIDITDCQITFDIAVASPLETSYILGSNTPVSIGGPTFETLGTACTPLPMYRIVNAVDPMLDTTFLAYDATT